MSATYLISALAAGSALLAVWCYVRWPRAAPQSFGRALVFIALAFVGLQAALVGLEITSVGPVELAVFAVVGLVVPALTYTFLASLWLLRLFAAGLNGIR